MNSMANGKRLRQPPFKRLIVHRCGQGWWRDRAAIGLAPPNKKASIGDVASARAAPEHCEPPRGNGVAPSKSYLG